MNKIIFFKKILLSLLLTLSVHLVNGQTASQSFGYDVGEYTVNSSTDFYLGLSVRDFFCRAGAVAPNAQSF